MRALSPAEIVALSQSTLSHYEQHADAFWHGTRQHDVSQNIQALLGELGGSGRRILDLGCGPGRDLAELIRLGHVAVGLDGCEAFVRMARERSGATVLHQDFLQLDLPSEEFDGVYANASLFHVPSQELPRVLSELWASLRPHGVLFSSNPHGDNREGYDGARYGAYHDEQRWSEFLENAGFGEVARYYRPEGLPRAQQPWLATLWRKRAVHGRRDASSRPMPAVACGTGPKRLRRAARVTITSKRSRSPDPARTSISVALPRARNLHFQLQMGLDSIESRR